MNRKPFSDVQDSTWIESAKGEGEEWNDIAEKQRVCKLNFPVSDSNL